MDMAEEDKNRIRQARHAYRMSVGPRAADADAERTLGAPAMAAADELQAASAAVTAGRGEDDPARAERERRAAALVEAVGLAARLVRARAARASLDDNGQLGDASAFAQVDDLVAGYFPHGQPGRIAKGGPALQVMGERFRGGIAGLGYDDVAAWLDAPLSAHQEALEAMSQESDELDAAQHRLVKARAELDRFARAGRAFVAWKAELDPKSGIDAAELYPVARQEIASEEAAALDDAGVADLDDGDGGDEESDLSDEPTKFF